MQDVYWKVVWKQFRKSRIGVGALCVLGFLVVVGIYAPLFASSKPLLVYAEGHFYFPLLRYLFYMGFYTKPIDIFFNLLMLTLPVAVVGLFFFKEKAAQRWLLSMATVQTALFLWLVTGVVKDPESHVRVKQVAVATHEDPLLAPFTTYPLWETDVKQLSAYCKLNQLLQYRMIQAQHERLSPFLAPFAEKTGREMPTLWNVRKRNGEVQLQQLRTTVQEGQEKYHEALKQLPDLIADYRPYSHAFILNGKMPADAEKYRIALEKARGTISNYQKAQADLAYLEDKENWLRTQSALLQIWIPPLVRTFHWEEDAGGAQAANQYLPWWELTRINRKDLLASLIFGIRVSVVVGLSAVTLALLIGIPLGLVAGYFAGKTDLVICRFIEMWEAMPTFFMLLLVIAITQSKSIFLVISVLGIFGWTGISRFMRSEVLKQRKLSYVVACSSLGYTHPRTMFSHILPNAIPPILTLLPFSIMAAITSEAGLSFLGLGEEGSTSWGVLMDEGRSVFPAESYLLWPPAILLTLLLISIALVGDRLRDALDPKMR